MKKRARLSYKDILHNLTKDKLLLQTKKKPNKNLLQCSFTIDAYDDQASENSCFIFFEALRKATKIRIKMLLSRGVTLFIVDDPEVAKLLPPDIETIFVSSSRKSWTRLLANFYKNPQNKVKIIAITGTNGKTTTAWILSQILNHLKFKAGYIGTLGTSIPSKCDFPHTTPDPDVLFYLLEQAVKQSFEYIVLEVSSHSIEQNKIEPIKFEAAVFTSFSRDHLDFHKSMENYLAIKLSLFSKKHLKQNAPVFASHKVYKYLGSSLLESFSPCFYSEQGENTNPTKIQTYRTIEEDINGCALEFTISTTKYNCKIPYLGSYNKDNFFASILLAQKLTNKISTDISQSLNQVPGRLEKVLVQSKKIPLIFIDYAHTPDALKQTLQILHKHKDKGKLYVIFGCGGDRDKGKRPLMGTYAEQFADHIILTTDNPRWENQQTILEDIQKGIRRKEKTHIIQNRKKAIIKTLESMKNFDCLLLAGKGHENYQEIKGIREPFCERTIVTNFYNKGILP